MPGVARRLLPIALATCLAPVGPAAAQCTLPGLADSPRMPGVPFEELSRQADESWQADRTEDAVRYYRAGVDLNPLWHDGWWRLGQALSEASCHEAARDALRRVVRLKPGAGPGWTLLGLSEYHLGLHDHAFADLSRGISLGATSAPEIGRRGLHTLTLLLIRRGDFTTPSRHLAILVRIEPDEPELVSACGLMALRRPQLPSEVPQADREVVAAAGRAACAAFAGRSDEARRGFQDLAARYPAARVSTSPTASSSRARALPRPCRRCAARSSSFPTSARPTSRSPSTAWSAATPRRPCRRPGSRPASSPSLRGATWPSAEPSSPAGASTRPWPSSSGRARSDPR
jgi:tetratricopeptide (TPR) repeat protein